MSKRKLILRSFLSPGDIVLLTAAVRDLHRNHPGQFITDVRTSCPELWENNPYVTPLRESDPAVRQIDCECPLIHRSNEAPYHAIHGFAQFLGSKLGVNVGPTIFAGDIHLSNEERRWKSIVHELAGRDLPFWIVNAGGKFDFTIKWWNYRRYQDVVDHFRGKILFVQVGEIGHYHPPLRNVVDLRGRTDLRQLVRLVYHAQGVLCGVTALMHLAAAVPTRPECHAARAGVIIAGGREPTHWEAYPHHQFLHTIGALRCCTTGGCWRGRTRPLGDGEKADHPNNVCLDVVRDLPRCMDLITAAEVVRRIESYFHGGANHYLKPHDVRAATRAVRKSLTGPRLETTVNLLTAPAAFEAAARRVRASSPPRMDGEGILLFAGDESELKLALDSARRVREQSVALPIECWTRMRCPRHIRVQFMRLGVKLKPVIAASNEALPATRAELRLHVLTRSSLRTIIMLGPGVSVRLRLEKLFRARELLGSGAMFPATHTFNGRPGIWKLCGLRAPRQTVDLSMFVIDRARCWSVIQLWRWIVERSYFFNGYLDGEGGAAQLAFAELRDMADTSRLNV